MKGIFFNNFRLKFLIAWKPGASVGVTGSHADTTSTLEI